jgi:hypothetical protein
MGEVSKKELLKRLRKEQKERPDKGWHISAVIKFIEAVDVPEDYESPAGVQD